MEAIILFDGYCNLCSGSVRFVIKRDPKGYFRFASLQSESGRRLLEAHGLTASRSIVLLEEGKLYRKSTAVLRICRHLKGLWKLLYILCWIPKPLRDRLYDVVARHRYQWFGKKDECLIPTPELRGRFLE
jgi:predicted DCC family thiol-disulfide oxidoreductase YuxK